MISTISIFSSAWCGSTSGRMRTKWKEAVELLKKQGKFRFFGASINFPYTAQDDAVPPWKRLSGQRAGGA